MATAPRWLMVSGGAEGDRTPDLCIANAALSQLSYSPKTSNFSRTAVLSDPPLSTSNLLIAGLIVRTRIENANAEFGGDVANGVHGSNTVASLIQARREGGN